MPTPNTRPARPGDTSASVGRISHSNGLFVRPTNASAVPVPPLIIPTAKIDALFRCVSLALDRASPGLPASRPPGLPASRPPGLPA